jgi:hypothetical protein
MIYPSRGTSLAYTPRRFGDLQAMTVPEVAVVIEPDCRRRVTVLPTLWSQVRVVEDPAVKE